VSPGNLFVRANYLATAVFGSVLPLLCGIWTLYTTSWAPILHRLPDVAINLAAMSLLLVPGIRAMRRVVTKGTVIPPELVHERPVVAGVVTLAGGIGHFFFVISMAVAIGIALAPEWPEEAGKILLPILAAFFFYFIALWCAELALVGNGQPDPPRASRELFP
jgi:hypothetical protein